MPTGPVALFGSDDQFVALFESGAVSVFRFDAFEDGQNPILTAKTNADLVKVYAAGGSTPLMLYGIDIKGRPLSVDFRPRRDIRSIESLTMKPSVKPLAETLDSAVSDIVVLRRKLVMTVDEGRSRRALYEFSRCSCLTTRLGDYNLNGEVSALEPERHNILVARHSGELRMMVTGDDAKDGGIETHHFEIDRVTAVTIAGGTHLVVARKGGYVAKVDLRAALPPSTARAADPFARLC